jgi:hypothetical protein
MEEIDNGVRSPLHVPDRPQNQNDEQFRVLTALIGCILVAEDGRAEPRPRDRSPRPVSPPVEWQGAVKLV